MTIYLCDELYHASKFKRVVHECVTLLCSRERDSLASSLCASHQQPTLNQNKQNKNINLSHTIWSSHIWAPKVPVHEACVYTHAFVTTPDTNFSGSGSVFERKIKAIAMTHLHTISCMHYLVVKAAR